MIKKNYTLVKHQFKYSPMTLEKRSAFLSTQGFCSISPAQSFEDAIHVSAAGRKVLVFGDPYNETLLFEHEGLYEKRTEKELLPPKIAHVLPEVRRLLLEGKSKEADYVSVKATEEDYGDLIQGWPINSFKKHPAFLMKIHTPEKGLVSDYLRTMDFTSGEATVCWTDNNGDYVRKIFVSISETATIQMLTPPENSGLDVDIEITTDIKMGTHDWDSFTMPESLEVEYESIPQVMLMHCKYGLKQMVHKGYAVMTRYIADGGSASVENNRLIIRGAKSLMLITRIELMEEYHQDTARVLAKELLQMEADYEKLHEKNKKTIGGMMKRSYIKISKGDDWMLSTEELLAQQHSNRDLSFALLEKLYDMGRFFLITETGKVPPAIGQYNINVNLQMCSGNITNLPEPMGVFFDFIESKLEDFRMNARSIFGCQGIIASIHPNQFTGLMTHFSYAFPHHYWVSCAGWIYNEFWGYYLVSGDTDFLKNHVIPGLREIALFFEDFLIDMDEKGKYIFYPCFSPEDGPPSKDWSPVTINACMDIMVLREVLENLIIGCETLGIETGNTLKWRAMLDKLPDYLLDEEGGLKEWAWPTIPENYNHRHVSHHYDVWPGNGITVDDTPELAKAVQISNRKRGQENDSAHGIIHRLFTAIRLKDTEDAKHNLKQILEHGFINRSLTTNHYPYAVTFPDITGSLPAVIAEMIVYSAVGIIEFLPALPNAITKGSIYGICCFTFAKADYIEWDLNFGRITSKIKALKSQSVKIRFRRGLKSVLINGINSPVMNGESIVNFEKDQYYQLQLEVKVI